MKNTKEIQIIKVNNTDTFQDKESLAEINRDGTTITVLHDNALCRIFEAKLKARAERMQQTPILQHFRGRGFWMLLVWLGILLTNSIMPVPGTFKEITVWLLMGGLFAGFIIVSYDEQKFTEAQSAATKKAILEAS